MSTSNHKNVLTTCNISCYVLFLDDPDELLSDLGLRPDELNNGDTTKEYAK